VAVQSLAALDRFVSCDVALEMSGRSRWKAWAGVTSFVTAFDNGVFVGCGFFSVHSSGSHENVMQVVWASE
jgi:hypothetical protein